MENRTTPKDFFLYLFAAGTLYVSATTLVTLLWQIINRWLPDTLGYDYLYAFDYAAAAIRWSVAILVIVFPAYVASMWWIGKDVDANPEKRELRVRRWFIWLTLFVASAVLLGDLVCVLYNFLGGELALRFFLKALSVAVVAGGVLAYHWYLLRREPGTGLQTRKALVAGTSLAVLAAIVTGVSAMGSPWAARAEANDQQRVSHLSELQRSVISFWQQKQLLPERLEEVIDPAYPMQLPVDPETGASYRYEKRGTRTFALCATFERAASDEEVSRATGYPIGTGAQDQVWAHGVGEQCFERTIDPDRYPPFNPEGEKTF